MHPMHRIRLLLVEDNPADAELAKAQLESQSTLHIDHVESVSQARTMMQSTNFDAVLADLTLLDSMGLQTVRELANGPALIILTGSDDSALEVSALEAGADEFLQKGASSEQIWQAIHFAIARCEARRELRAIIEGNGDAMIVLDEHRPDANAKVLYANPAAAALLELARDQMTAPVAQGEVIELVVDSDTGTRVWQGQTTSLTWEGRPAVLATYRDITERRRHEERQLLHRDRLASIGQLTAGIAHEINNPAGFIASNLDYLDAQLRALLPETEDKRQLLSMVADCQAGTHRIVSIVRDLRGFARAQDERTDLQINDLIQAAVTLTGTEIRPRANLELDLGDLPVIVGERNRLLQVFVNLLVNAAQAIEPGDATRHRIWIRSHVRGGRIEVTVADSGVGIPEALRHRIFEPFFTTKTSDSGTGLGLSLCLETVRRHQGTLEVFGEPGGGARFTVTLPVDLARTGPTTELPTPDITPEQTHRILLIDDEPMIRRAFCRMLKPHEVVEADGGYEALKRMTTEAPFDVVVCDIMMSAMDGPTFFREVVRREPSYRDRFLFVSGGAYTESAHRFINEFSPPLLEKPIARSELLRAIQATLDGAGLPGQ